MTNNTDYLDQYIIPYMDPCPHGDTQDVGYERICTSCGEVMLDLTAERQHADEALAHAQADPATTYTPGLHG